MVPAAANRAVLARSSGMLARLTRQRLKSRLLGGEALMLGLAQAPLAASMVVLALGMTC